MSRSSLFGSVGNRESVLVTAQSPCRSSQLGWVPLVAGVEVRLRRMAMKEEVGARPSPGLFLGSDLLKTAASAEFLCPGFPRKSSSSERKVSLSRVSQLPRNQSRKTREI